MVILKDERCGMLTNNRSAFTMIELVFIIVIIGILASVAIPRLAGNRTDAEASVCANNVGQLIEDIGTTYSKEGNNLFRNLPVSRMTNITIIANDTSIDRGIKEDNNVDTSGIVFVCDNEEIVEIVGANAAGRYNLTVNVMAGSTPASLKATENIKRHILGGLNTKNYTL